MIEKLNPYNKEAEPHIVMRHHFSIDPPEFTARLKGKSVRDRFVVGQDIQAVSRASITMNGAARALRDASRAVAKAFLTPDQIK